MNFNYFVNEELYNDLDKDKCIKDLSEVIKFKTISYTDQSKMDFNEFHKLHEYLKKAFPLTSSKAEIEIINKGSMIWHIKGTNKESKEVLFMAHLDVVSVIPNTINDWEYDPFSGEITEEYIYGRGSEDIKCMAICYLEAIEYLLKKNYSFKQGVYLCFGHDEETLGGMGQEKIRDLLKARNVQLDFVLDEGGAIEKGEDFMIDNPVAMINIMEKGYADLIITSDAIGGHSSNPGFSTSLGRVAKAISLLEENQFKPYLNSVVKEMLEVVSKYTKDDILKTYDKNDINNLEKIKAYIYKSPTLSKYVYTTTASTMISGGSESPNVLTRKVTAKINYRMIDINSSEDVLNHALKIFEENNLDVKVTLGNHTNASNISSTDSNGFKLINSTINKFYKDIVIIPSMICGGTDCYMYNEMCDNCYRFVPIFNDLDKCGNCHNTNERCQKRAFVHGVKFMIYLIENI